MPNHAVDFQMQQKKPLREQELFYNQSKFERDIFFAGPATTYSPGS
jgi:hypothetical protein